MGYEPRDPREGTKPQNRDFSDDFVQFGSEAVRAALDAAQWPEKPARGYDFNDMAREQGGEAVRASIDAAEPQGWRLPVIDTTRWSVEQPPEPDWLVPGWLLRRTAGLMVGEDGVGKSLLAQQLCTCVAAGKPFLGMSLTQAPALYITCEDDADMLWRRQRSINRALGVPIGAAPAELVSLVGNFGLTEFGNQLTHMVEGSHRPTPTMLGIARHARTQPFGLIVLDNAAHHYAGNENVRPEVAAFIGALEWLARLSGAAVLLLAHPNKAGDEYSGSTGWSAHVRQRWFLTRPDDQHDDDTRILRKSKANYAKRGDEVAFRWHEWAFVQDRDLPDDTRAEMAEVVRRTGDNAAFLACLAAREAQGEGRLVGPTPGPNYAPTQFEGMPEAKGLRRERLKAAMNRLFAIGEIESHTYRNVAKGRNVTVIRVASPNPELPPRTAPEHSPRSSPNSSPELSRAHSLYTTYIGDAAHEAAASPKDTDNGLGADDMEGL